MKTSEYRRGLVAAYYRNILGRSASSGEIQYWANQMNAGVSDEQIITTFLSSKEFFARAGNSPGAFVTQLYRLLLTRNPGASEVNWWVKQYFASRGNRTPIVQAIVNSSERRQNMVRGWFQLFLHRAPENAALNAFVNALSGGATEEAVQAEILGTPEYFSLQR